MKKLVAQSLLYFGMLLPAAGAAQDAPAQTPKPAEPAKTEAAAAPKKAVVDQAAFQKWLKEFKKSAASQGISKKVLDEALPDDMRAVPEVIDRDRNQPGINKTSAKELEELKKDPVKLAEYKWKKSLAYYLQKQISKERIDLGVGHVVKNSALLQEISGKYGPPPEVIVALWGLESSYSNIPPRLLYNMPQALATLAYDGRRSEFFRKELMATLRILDEDHIPASVMQGSWAGAFGGVQFMPTSFFAYAVDYDGDGQRDIINTRADIFASAANHVAKIGWVKGEDWGREVKMTKQLDAALIGHDLKRQPLQFWRDKGIVMPDGSEISGERASKTATLIQPDGPGTKAYLAFDNFHVIRKWNKSNYFVVSVGTLSDAIKKGVDAVAPAVEKQAAPPVKSPGPR